MTKFSKSDWIFLFVIFLVFGQPLLIMYKDIEYILGVLLLLSVFLLLDKNKKNNKDKIIMGKADSQFKNKYFFLRHGQNVHQAEYPDIIYLWPDGNPPYSLTELGKEQAQQAGEKLKKDGINRIFSSDILRCRETAKIVAGVIGYNINDIIYDTRLRDLNWGDFGGKTKEEYWAFYGDDHMKAFDLPAPGGESWNQCRERAVKLLQEIEEEFSGECILIVSHGDLLWLLEGYMRGRDDRTLLEERGKIYPGTGEVKEIS